MPNYIFNPPTRRERPANTHRLFSFFSREQGLTVVRTGSTYAIGEWFNQDETDSFDEFWLGGHQHEVTEATREGLINAGIGITTDNFTAI
jgi:hypothetical protein